MKEERLNEIAAQKKKRFGLKEGEAEKSAQIIYDLEQKREKLPENKALELDQKIRTIASGSFIKTVSIPSTILGGKYTYWVKAQFLRSQPLNKQYTIVCEAAGLEVIEQLIVYFDYDSYPPCVQPTTDEVLYQIPEEIRDEAIAFELSYVDGNINTVFEQKLEKYKLLLTLYRGTMPQEIKNLEVQI